MVSLISPAHLPPSFDAYADYPMASSSSTSFYPPPPGDDNFPPTQEASQSQTSYISPDFTSWAILDPFDQSMPQLDFGIPYPIIQIGRRPPPYNMFCLEGLKISAIHCKIEWDGFGGYKLQDLSHNGTFVNDVRVPKGQWRVIRNGDILAFGSRHLYKYVFKATNLDGINDPRFKYEIIQSIGSGSFGDVYKALVRETGTYVAIKHIRLAKKSYDASLVKRELVMLETFKHPNIVKFHHAYACTGDGIPGAGVRLVLEYVDGLDIANWSADRHVVDEAMYQHFFYQICEAMGYLHTLNVAHRDLKLENVLLTSHDPPIIKIADFGLAKVVDSRLTHFKTNCGTPITMAPEQCSASTYTTIVDSWAVGTMLYMLVCNELPIWGRRGNPHWYRNAAQWKADLGEVLETFNATPISSAAKSFINCLLQWDPDHRAPLLSMLDEEWMQEYLPPVYDFTSDPPVKQRDLRRAHSNVRPPFPRPGGNRALPSSRVPPSPEQTGTGTVMPDTAPGADLHLYVPTVRDTSGSSGSIPGLGH